MVEPTDHPIQNSSNLFKKKLMIDDENKHGKFLSLHHDEKFVLNENCILQLFVVKENCYIYNTAMHCISISNTKRVFLPEILLLTRKEVKRILP